MSHIADQSYLQHAQYKDSANLTARANLHRRFSTHPGFIHWLFDQLALQPGQRVLEVGGGPGWLWRENAGRGPDDLQVCFSDFSPGMVREARRALAGDHAFAFATLDAQAISAPSGAFDLVIANHMLYHVPDVPRSLRELARVLRTGGHLLAATNGARHLREMHALLREFEPRYVGRDPSNSAGLFGLENGPALVAPSFVQIEVRRHVDSLWITEARPLTDYVLSLWDVGGVIDASRADELNAFFQDKIDAAGGIHITKDCGVIIAVKP
jgi:ubiquinone/menaquinone biosynthesis C-methylase UbiE